MEKIRKPRGTQDIFSPDVETWVKIENRAKREGKTPESVAAFILSRRVGLIPQGAAK